MPVSRREFLGTAAAASGAAVVAVTAPPAQAQSATAGESGGLDAELPLHVPERPVEVDGQDPFGRADAEILDHALSPEWRARLVYRMTVR